MNRKRKKVGELPEMFQAATVLKLRTGSGSLIS